MQYDQYEWNDGDPISKQRLNNMETGIYNANNSADTAITNVTNLATQINNTVSTVEKDNYELSNFLDFYGAHPWDYQDNRQHGSFDFSDGTITTSTTTWITDFIKVPQSKIFKFKWTAHVGQNTIRMCIYSSTQGFLDSFYEYALGSSSTLTSITTESFILSSGHTAQSLEPGMYVRFSWPGSPNNNFTDMAVCDAYAPDEGTLVNQIKNISPSGRNLILDSKKGERFSVSYRFILSEGLIPGETYIFSAKITITNTSSTSISGINLYAPSKLQGSTSGSSYRLAQIPFTQLDTSGATRNIIRFTVPNPLPTAGDAFHLALNPNSGYTPAVYICIEEAQLELENIPTAYKPAIEENFTEGINLIANSNKSVSALSTTSGAATETYNFTSDGVKEINNAQEGDIYRISYDYTFSAAVTDDIANYNKIFINGYESYPYNGRIVYNRPPCGTSGRATTVVALSSSQINSATKGIFFKNTLGSGGTEPATITYKNIMFTKGAGECEYALAPEETYIKDLDFTNSFIKNFIVPRSTRSLTEGKTYNKNTGSEIVATNYMRTAKNSINNNSPVHIVSCPGYHIEIFGYERINEEISIDVFENLKFLGCREFDNFGYYTFDTFKKDTLTNKEHWICSVAITRLSQTSGALTAAEKTDITSKFKEYVSVPLKSFAYSYGILPAQTDLNTIDKTSFYYCSDSNYVNMPAEATTAATVFTIVYDNRITQMVIDGYGNIWTRKRTYALEWLDWYNTKQPEFQPSIMPIGYPPTGSIAYYAPSTTGHRLRIGTWNVAGYRMTNSTQLSEYPEKIANIRQFFINQHLDCLCVQEHNPYIDTYSNSGEKLAYDYLYKYNLQDDLAEGSHRTRIFSNLQTNNTTHVPINSIVSNSYPKRGFTYTTINLNNAVFLIVCVHNQNSNNPYNNDSNLGPYDDRDNYLTTLSNTLQSLEYTYCIICGDFNSSNYNGYDTNNNNSKINMENKDDFTRIQTFCAENNLIPINGGLFGWFPTCTAYSGFHQCLDNILISNSLKLINVDCRLSTAEELYSDHAPIIVELEY